MKFVRYFPAVGLAAAAAGPAENTPIGKVVGLLKDMKSKAEADKAEEMALHKEILKTVHHQNEVLDEEVRVAAELNERKAAEANNHNAQAESQRVEAGDAKTEWTKYTAELRGETLIRTSQKATFDKESTNLKESVDALERAVAVVKGDQGPTAMAELQRVLPSDLMSLVQKKAAPQASQASYTAASGKVLELLESLHKEFSDKLQETLDAESSRAHNCAMKKVDLDDEIKNFNQENLDKTAAAVDNEEKGAARQQEADAAKTQHDALVTQQEGLATYNTEEQAQFQINQAARAEELNALGTAISIMEGDSVSGTGEKHLPALVQKAHSFLQLQTNVIQEVNRFEVSSEKAALLQEVSEMLSQENHVRFNNKSKALSMLSVRMLTDAQGPFNKIIGIINRMITKLNKEANAEEKHNNFCTKELEQNQKARDSYEQGMKDASNALETAKANKAEAIENIKAARQEQKELAQALKEMTEVRNEESKFNLATIQESKDAQTAVSEAMKALEAFYNKTFLQMSQSPSVTTPKRQIQEYTGRSKGESGGVMGLLKIVHADFARLQKDTQNAEKASERTFEDFTSGNWFTQGAAELKESDNKTQKGEAEEEIDTQTAALEQQNKMYDAAMAYYKKLEPACVQEHVSYEERVKMREDEIESLKQALAVLEADPRFQN